MGYVHSMNDDTVYAAIKVLTNNTALNYSIDLDGSGGIDVNGGGFSTSEKYGTLSTLRSSSGGPSGADVAHVVATGAFSLNPGEHEVIAFAILAGDSLLDIEASADAAQIRYDTDDLNVEEDDNVNQIRVYPNPTAGIIKVFATDRIQVITVRNILGEIIQEFTTSKINMATYSNGVYFIEVITKKFKKIEKLILAK